MKFEKKIANFITKYPFPILLLLLIVTVIMGLSATRVKIATSLEDLLPQKHANIQLQNKYEKYFGGSNMLYLGLSVKDGDIFNKETLTKVKRITEGLNYIDGVNRYKIYSISHRKVKDIKVNEWGISTPPLIENIPTTDEELKKLKDTVFNNSMVYGPLVSADFKSTLIVAQLVSEGIDYSKILQDIKALCSENEDDNNVIAISGNAMIRAYLYSYLGETKLIFIITLLAMALLLFFYTRSAQMTIIPMLSALMSAIWGLGFIGYLGYVLDPLVLIVPILITARTLSHSLQFNERFIEEYANHGERKSAIQATIESLFVPGLVGIVTDAAGIFVLILVPIPILQKMGVFCVFWAFTTIFSVLFANPVYLHYFTFFQGRKKVDDKHKKIGFVDRMLLGTTVLYRGKKRSWIVVGICMMLGLVAWGYASQLKVGDVHPGSPLFWPKSDYNQAATFINNHFRGLDPMIIVLEGQQEGAMYSYQNLHSLEGLQLELENLETCGGTESIVDLIKAMDTLMHEDHPKWRVLPQTRKGIASLIFMYQAGADPGDLDRFLTVKNDVSSITAYFKDHTGETIRQAMGTSKNYIKSRKDFTEKATFYSASGVIGSLSALNDTIEKSAFLLLAMGFVLTYLFCSMAFRSFVGGFLLLVPLVVSNYLVYSYMGLAKIGLNVSTMPVATIAIGIGVDYGIYLLSRICEEYKRTNDWNQTFMETILTTGKAITFTAFTVIFGVVFWVFSSIKFQADLGLLLSIVTMFHLIGTLILLPALVFIIKPKFITKVTS
jgi:predicted RND superfamily exporter protein